MNKQEGLFLITKKVSIAEKPQLMLNQIKPSFLASRMMSSSLPLPIQK